MLHAPSWVTSCRWVAVLAAAGAIIFVLPAGPVHAQTASTAAASSRTIDPNGTSCKELKAALEKSGALTLVSEPRGGGDTYYGRVPQCEFWQRPAFAYVDTKDGRCGVGYVCTAKISGK